MARPRVSVWDTFPEPVTAPPRESRSSSPLRASAAGRSGKSWMDRAPGSPFLGFLSGALISAVIWGVVASLWFFLA